MVPSGLQIYEDELTNLASCAENHTFITGMNSADFGSTPLTGK